MTARAPAWSSRAGWGFDAHRLNTSPPVVLAGVTVSDELGVDATSDGDVLAHAVIDALLGACVLGDIGQLFPSDDPIFGDADSMDLLRRAVGVAQAGGWVPVHVDVTLIAERVKIAPHREEMRHRLSETLGIPVEAVSVKATTTDGMGLIGSSEGLAAAAIVTVEPSS